MLRRFFFQSSGKLSPKRLSHYSPSRPKTVLLLAVFGACLDCFRCSCCQFSARIWTVLGASLDRFRLSSWPFSMLVLTVFGCHLGPFSVLIWNVFGTDLNRFRCSSVLFVVSFLSLRQRRTRSCANASSDGALSGDHFTPTCCVGLFLAGACAGSCCCCCCC